MGMRATWRFFTAFLVGLLWTALLLVRIDVVSCYRRHGIPSVATAPKRGTFAVAAEQEEAGIQPKEDDKQIAKQLMLDSQKKMAEYLSPMVAANVQGMSQRELEDTFGEAFTQENIKRRRERNARAMQHMPPDVPPTKALPYFVNLQDPKSPLGSVSKALVGDSGVSGGPVASIPEVTETEGLQNGCNGSTGSLEATGDMGSLAASSGATSKKMESTPFNDQGNASIGHASATEGSSQKRETPRTAPMPIFGGATERLFETDPDEEYVGDPLDPLFEAAERAASDTEDEEEEDEEEAKELWYRKNFSSSLFPVDMADGWSILPCGRIFKHVLRPSYLPPQRQRRPEPQSYVSFSFKLMDAFTGEVLLETRDMDSDGMISQLEGLGEGLEKMVASMVTGEQAEFVCHAMELDLTNLKEEGLENLQWMRMWIHLITLHNPGEKWWHVGPFEAAKFPEAKPDDSKLTKMERLNLKSEELVKQVEAELEHNPCSPLWDDVMQKLSTQQKASVLESFDRKMEMQERMKCSEYSGSRGFGEALKSSGQIAGYDVGRASGGSGAFYTWHETPFIFYVAVPVVPGVRAEHVKLMLEPWHLTLKVAGKVVIDDEIRGQVQTDIATNWAMSEKAMEYEPLPEGHPELQDPVLKVSAEDSYHKMIKEPCIIIALKKQDKVMGTWGTPFVNI